MFGILLIVVVIAVVGGVIVSALRSAEELKSDKNRVDSQETLMTVAQYLHLVDAQSAQMRLESEDIETYLADENFILLDPLYSPAAGGVRIQVRSSDMTRAREVLAMKPEITEEPVEKYEGIGDPCPKCGSYNIYQYKDFFGLLSASSAFLIGLPLPRKRMYCFYCKHRWKGVQQPKPDKIDYSYKKIVLDDRAVKYIAGKLDDLSNIKNYDNGKDDTVKFEGKVLAKLILESVDLKQGAIYAILPNKIPLKQVYKFENGGIISLSDADRANTTLIEGGVMVPTPNNFSRLYPVIKEHLKANAQNICIFIDAMSNADDKCMQEEQTDLFTFQNNVYWYVTAANAEEDKIKTARGNSSDAWIGFLGVLTSAEKIEIPPFDKRELTAEELEAFAKNTNKIVISAYDGESFLIWEKSVS